MRIDIVKVLVQSDMVFCKVDLGIGGIPKVEKDMKINKKQGIHSLNCSFCCSKGRRKNLIFFHLHMSTGYVFFDFWEFVRISGGSLEMIELTMSFLSKKNMMEDGAAFTLKAQHRKHMTRPVLRLFYCKDIKGDK